MKRAEIRLCELPAPDKRRPVLVLSRDVAVAHLRSVIVAPITTRIRGLPSEVRLGEEHGLKSECVVNLDNLFRVDKARLRRYVGMADAATMAAVCRALNVALGCI